MKAMTDMFNFALILTAALILLKSLGVIGWSWWWVVSPVPLLLAFFAILILLAVAFAFILMGVGYMTYRIQQRFDKNTTDNE